MPSANSISLFIGVCFIAGVLCQTQSRCTDTRNDCNSLARTGYCRTHRAQMLAACPLSCNFCTSLPQAGEAVNAFGNNSCEDTSINCTAMERRGLCQTLPQMRWMCARTCGFCQGSQPFRTIVNPDFDCGRPYPARPRGGVVARIVRQAPNTQQPVGNSVPQEKPFLAGTARPQTVEDAICGATVIHPRYLLTAAHCVLDPTRPVRSIRLGELDFSQQDETNSRPIDYAVEVITVHPDFDPNLVERYNDIALIKTARDIEFNEVVYPFCLTPERPPPNAVVSASGFGKVNETSRSPVLQEAELKVISLADCEASYQQMKSGDVLRQRYPNLLQGHDTLCAGDPGKGPCEGDGGGPLFRTDENGRRFLVGVISITLGCKGPETSDLPGIYVSTADHIDFIDSVIYEF
ncbi:CLIP domain-containing serine protease B4-like [Palaemon carinicauda]|uniref:CLIP domain-containing serine protease B4-like n=1 Tax=Palaemon carinicauda TaxID=392227 RepID=UPI0035B582A4